MLPTRESEKKFFKSSFLCIISEEKAVMFCEKRGGEVSSLLTKVIKEDANLIDRLGLERTQFRKTPDTIQE